MGRLAKLALALVTFPRPEGFYALGHDGHAAADPKLPFQWRTSHLHICRSGHDAAVEFVSHPGAGQRHGTVLPVARLRLGGQLPGATRAVRDA